MLRVLLADDEPIFLEFMSSVIDWKSLGCEIVATARDGAGALKFIHQSRLDIAFIDISMPIMDGMEVCAAVREENLPIDLVIVTGHDEFSAAYQAIKLGINDFLLKPFSKEELIQCLQKLMDRRQAQFVKAESAQVLDSVSSIMTKYEILASMVDDYLYAHFSDTALNLQIISDHLNFDYDYLRRIYKMTRGITIIQKLENVRIEEAKRLLKDARFQGSEIAEKIGFSDPFYFSKRFKLITGLTPTEYRQSISGKSEEF